MNESPGEHGPVADSSLTLQQFLYILYRGRRFGASVLLGIFLLFTFIAFTRKPQFTAVASFLPPETDSGAGGALLAQVSALGGGLFGGARSSGDQSVGILRSQTIGRRMVKRFNLIEIYHVKKESQAMARLLANTDLTANAKENLVAVRITDGDPERASRLANGYLEELQSLTAQLALTENSKRRLFYEERLTQEKDALANAEIALKKSEEQSGLISPIGQANTELQAIAQLRAQIAQRKVDLADLLRNETDQNPDVLRLRSGLASLESQVAQMEKGKQGPAGDITRAQVPALELEYIRLQREVKYHETLFDILSKQYEAARLDESHDAPLQVLDRAVTPDSKSGPKRLFILLAGLVFGTVAGIMVVLLRAWWRNFKWQPDAAS